MISLVENSQSVPAQYFLDSGHQRKEEASEDADSVTGDSDTVSISSEGKALQKTENDSRDKNSEDKELSEEEKSAVQKLKKRDRDVKAHESAHMAAGGGIVQGGASYEYERGPDGKMYAVGGEVKIDTSSENDPQATIRKMKQVKMAALAPAQPSGQDRAVAAQAAQAEAQARIELTEQKSEDAEKAKAKEKEEPDSYWQASLPGISNHSTSDQPAGSNINVTI